MTPRKKSPPKKPQEPEATVPVAPVDVPAVPATKPKRRRRGSPKGKLNLWERLYAIGKAVGVAVTTLLVALAEQAKDSLPLIQQTAPVWIGILIGGIAGTVIYYHEASALKDSDNTDGGADSDAANPTSTGTGES